MRGMLVLVLLAVVTGCANVEKQGLSPEIQERRQGYLTTEQLPDGVGLLPAPPAGGSAALARDEETSRASFAMRDTARWAVAIRDADLSLPAATDTFACPLNARISEGETPHLYNLLRRVLNDVSRAVARPKDTYKRPRPFMVNEKPFCTPDWEAALRKSGSYPSGHTAAGWAWALILSEVAPDRADAVLRRGRAFGMSRVVCNVHWLSDVEEGRTLAAAVVARLHAAPAFRADLDWARAEFAALAAREGAPVDGCQAEAEALALFPPAGTPASSR